jgi:hypothetical protein
MLIVNFEDIRDHNRANTNNPSVASLVSLEAAGKFLTELF